MEFVLRIIKLYSLKVVYKFKERLGLVLGYFLELRIYGVDDCVKEFVVKW